MVGLGWSKTCWNWKQKCLTPRLKMLGQWTLCQIISWSCWCHRCRLIIGTRYCWIPYKQCWSWTRWKSRFNCRQIVSLQSPFLIRCTQEIPIPRWSQERRNNWRISPFHLGRFIRWIGSYPCDTPRVRNPCCLCTCQIRFRHQCWSCLVDLRTRKKNWTCWEIRNCTKYSNFSNSQPSLLNKLKPLSCGRIHWTLLPVQLLIWKKRENSMPQKLKEETVFFIVIFRGKRYHWCRHSTLQRPS